MERQALPGLRRLTSAAKHVLWMAPFLASCSTLQVYSAQNPTASIPTYRTYAHASPEAAPAGFARSALTAAIWVKVQADIDVELASKGFTVARGDAKPDFLVSSGSGRRTEQRREGNQVHDEGADWVASEETVGYTQATLAIDAFDGRTRALVWHGSSRRALGASPPTAVNEASLAEAVSAILRKFPRAAAAAPAAQPASAAPAPPPVTAP